MTDVRPSLGVNVALIDNGRMLLTRREDFEVWCLPGGAVDRGETCAEAAVREMREETGIDVTLETLVGMFYQTTGFHTVVFTARAAAGTTPRICDEVVEIGFFSKSNLPDDIMWWYRLRIMRAFAGATGEVWLQDLEDAFPGFSRTEVYAVRDRQQGTRRAFYETYLSHRGSRGEERHL